MSTSDIFATTDPRLRNLMRQYSDYFRQNNLNIQNFNLTQSSHPAQMYQLSQTNDLLLNGQNRRQSDVRSLIQQLMIKKQIKTNPIVNVNTPIPVLVSTEQRIFQEVINLLMEINQIKETIQKEKDLTLKLQAERDSLLNKGGSKTKNKKPNDFEMQSIINKLKSKQGDDLKISAAQLEKISAENQHLEKNINRLKLKSKGNLKQVLEQQKQKYRNLKKKLEEKNNQSGPSYGKSMQSGSSPEIVQQIIRLQSDIDRLQMSLEDGGNIGFQIKKLSEENQRLKQKTFELIKNQRKASLETPQETEQRRRLEEYIRQQQQNKILFFQDLKKFKEQYNASREQNQDLKKRLKGSHSGSRVDRYQTKGRYNEDSKFGKYQDLMSQMNTVMK